MIDSSNEYKEVTGNGNLEMQGKGFCTVGLSGSSYVSLHDFVLDVARSDRGSHFGLFYIVDVISRLAQEESLIAQVVIDIPAIEIKSN